MCTFPSSVAPSNLCGSRENLQTQNKLPVFKRRRGGGYRKWRNNAWIASLTVLSDSTRTVLRVVPLKSSIGGRMKSTTEPAMTAAWDLCNTRSCHDVKRAPRPYEAKFSVSKSVLPLSVHKTYWVTNVKLGKSDGLYFSCAFHAFLCCRVHTWEGSTPPGRAFAHRRRKIVLTGVRRSNLYDLR